MFDPVAYINEPRWHHMSLGLDRMRELLRRLGNPQDGLRFVHVAGTNGKGSTCAFLARILQEAGYREGLFTSPYLICFEERIRVDGQNIPLDDLREVTWRVRACAEAMSEHPTEFELMTAVAFCYFAKRECDIAVVEVGLGGRLDSTNVIETVEVSVVTPISLDHCALLGDTVGAIAEEKAGIVKRGVPVVSAPQEPAAAARLRDRAARLDAEIRFVDPVTLSGTNDDFSYGAYRHLRVALAGGYQRVNAATALEACRVLRERGWRIDDEAMRTGFATASWPGRFEVVGRDPDIVIDGAHNPQGARALADELACRYPSGGVVFVLGVLADKDYGAVLDALVPLGFRFVCTEPPNPRALSAGDLAQAVGDALTRAGRLADDAVLVEPDIAAAVRRGRVLAADAAALVFCGSLYGIGAVKKALAQEE